MKKCRLNNLVCLVLVGLLSACALAQAATEQGVDALNQSTRVTMQKWLDKYQLPSLSIAVSLHGELVFADAIGFADVEKQRLANASTQYSVGSIAKPMTALAMARLMDQNKLSTDTVVGDLIEQYPASHPAMTIRQLASHTAGVGRPWATRRKLEFDEPRDFSSPREVLSAFINDELSYAPGSQFEYTSMGYVLLSAAIESAAKQDYVNVMQRQVWQPLSMTATELDDSKAGMGSEATYYAEVDDSGQFVKASDKRDRSFLFGGGGFISTPSDLVRMVNAWSDNYLTEQTLNTMTTPVLMPSGQMNEQFYALGWRIHDMQIDGKDVLAVHHGGVTWKAATSFVFMLPEFGAAIAYSTNMSPQAFGEVRSHMIEMLTEYVRQSLVPDPM